MSKIVRGRWTDGHDESIVVFLIGMRINRLWRMRSWVPVAAAMGPMLTELSGDPDSGFLGYRITVGWRGPLLVQYWRDTESLLRYAQSGERSHRPAWQAFNRRARTAGGAVGVWHETYAVDRGAHETMYVDMPTTGLALATTVVPVEVRGETAGQRLATGTDRRP